MSIKNFGKIILIVGLVGISISILPEIFRIGKPGFKASQLLIIQLGVFLSALALGILASPGRESRLGTSVREKADKILNLPVYVWVMSGFIFTFFCFFILPVFFNQDFKIVYFFRYIPDRVPIGVDFRVVLDSVRSWMNGKEVPAILYPPLENFFFAPFLLLAYPHNYYLISVITLMSFFILTFVIPRSVIPQTEHPIIPLIIASTIISYGFQFELERGQFHTIALTLSILAIYLFHYHDHYKFLAYLLLSFSIQLKIFPVIFILLLIKDWKDWKNNIIRVIGFGFFNFGLLFLLGPNYFFAFVKDTLHNMNTPETWIGNHSIKAFTTNLAKNGFGIFPGSILQVIRQNTSSIELLLFSIYILCLGLILIQAYRQNKPGLNTALLLVCTLGCLILPAINHDYTLGYLAGPVAIALGSIKITGMRWKKIISIVLVFIATCSYSTLLYPFKYRPAILGSSFPMLLVLLISFTLLALITSSSSQPEATITSKA